MAHVPFKVHQISDTSSLTYFTDVATLIQIADDHPDAALRDTNFMRNFPGGNSRMFGEKRKNRCVVRDKGPRFFVLAVATNFLGIVEYRLYLIRRFGRNVASWGKTNSSAAHTTRLIKKGYTPL
jgi:hypothetical protein